MPRGKREATDLDRTWDDATECLRAYRKRPNAANKAALDAALEVYQREWLADFDAVTNPDAPAKLQAVG